MNDVNKMSSSTDDVSKRELLQYIRDDQSDEKSAAVNSPRFGIDNSVNKYDEDDSLSMFRKTNSKMTTNKKYVKILFQKECWLHADLYLAERPPASS